MSTSDVPSDTGAGVERMLAAIRGLPAQFSIGARFAAGVGAGYRGAVDAVVICGMGGSAFPGDLLALATQGAGVPVTVSRGYEISAPAGPRTLVVISSFSGNTEETLSALAEARSGGASVVVLTAGGALERMARADGLPLILLEKPTPDFQPRAATAYFVGALAQLLQDVGLWDDGVGLCAQVAQDLRGLEGVEVEARAIGVALRDRIPVFYASSQLAQTAARIAKIKINENAKMPAFFNAVPEFNHNEMVGFTRMTGPFTVVLFQDAELSDRMRQRMAVSASTLRAHGVPVLEVHLRGRSPLARAFHAIHLFDFASVGLAVAAGVDPNPVAMVESFKARLADA